jgi:peptide/nickel transport system permease protein
MSFFSAGERAMIFVSPFAYSHPGRDIYSALPELIKKYNLDAPFYVQYLTWLKGLLTEGTLGYSLEHNKWVTTIIAEKFPATLEIVMYSAPIIILGGIRIGSYAAKRANERKRREDPLDFIIRLATTSAYSVPTFFLALLVISIFLTTDLHWATFGRVGINAFNFIHSTKWHSYTNLYTIDALFNGQLWIFIDALQHLVLPVIIVTFSTLPVIVRVTRSIVLGELGSQYVTMAKAQGLRKSEVLSRARRNALIPILTVSSIIFTSMLTGLMLTEYIFTIDGLGLTVIRAALIRDFPLLTGLAVFFCILFTVMNFIVDIIYTYLDPRVRL